MRCESCGHENIEGARFCASCGVQQATGATGDAWAGKLVGGRFKVTKVLGEGGMGVVYAAEQHMGSTVRKVAIKTLHPHLSRDPSVLARFHRECGTVSQLEHPNTIKVFDFGEQDGTLYIAMEFVEGRSLDKVIATESPLSPARVVAILSQVAGALDEAHAQGIVHRDLKPENIILGERLGKKDFVKVLDFGIAARTEKEDAQREKKLTQQGMVLGTPPYMSPEQFTGVELDRRSDVYSLAVIAYEMLVGRLPFEADTPWQWATEHMTAQPFPIEQVPTGAGVPRGMRDAVMRGLAKHREDRQDSAGQLVSELEAGVTGLGRLSVNAPTEEMQAVPTAPRTTREAPVSPPTGSGVAHTQALEIPKKSSNTGALLGVAIGAVVVLGGGGAYLATRSGGAQPDPVPSASAPEVVSAPPPSASAAPLPPPSASASPSAAPESSAAPISSGPAPTSSAAPVSSTTGGTTKPPVTPVKPKIDCSKCASLVSSGSWTQAAATYAACDASVQTSCGAVARREAVSQARAASQAGKCSQAKTIQAASKKMGAHTTRVDDAVNQCK